MNEKSTIGISPVSLNQFRRQFVVEQIDFLFKQPQIARRLRMEEYPKLAILEELISFSGHTNITALHRNTIELTKDPDLSKRGDCIIGVCASKACRDLSTELKSCIQSGKELEFELSVENEVFRFSGKGDRALSLLDDKEIVLRKSDYLSERTAALSCSAAAQDIPRPMISKLKNPLTKGLLLIRALPFEPANEFHWSLP